MIWGALISFLLMRATPVRWWSVMIVVAILAFAFKAEMLGMFVHLCQKTTPTYPIERIEAGGKNKGLLKPAPYCTTFG